MSRAPLNFAKLMVIFSMGLVAVALWHVVLVADQIALTIAPALSLGLATGGLIAGVGALWKHPWWGGWIGSVVSYMVTMGYVLFVNRIPVEWFYG